MTTDTKLSIYAGEPLALALAGYAEGRSARVNTVCARYLGLVAEFVPTFTRAEWSAICDALNGVWLRDEHSLRFSWAEIADCEGLGAQWGIDQEALAIRVRELDLARTIALVETVERFWLRCDLPTDEALKQAGARLANTDAPAGA